MKLAIGPLVATCAILWGGLVMLCAFAYLLWPPYAEGFLKVLASVYPGYTAEPTFGGMVNVTLYALIDGALGGLILGGLYNLLASKCGKEGGQ